MLQELASVAAPYGLRVNTKVRVADVCPTEGSGISKELFKYALMAHFDFLMTNDDHVPQFAVEFDGPHHNTPKIKLLDAKKDALCQVFNFPLLRIKISYLPKKYNRLSLLEWIIDVYHMEEAFNEAQAKGNIPPDEPFDPFLILATGVNGDTRRFPYWISRDANIAIKRLHKQGKIALPGTSGFIGKDARGNIRGIEYLKVNDTHGILVKSGMRSQLFPMSFTDLLRELLLILVYEKLKEYLVTGSGLVPIATIDRIAQLYQSRLEGLGAHSTG